MKRSFRNVQFERYADDAIVHCKPEQQARAVLEAIRGRFERCGLERHSEKTRIVYCKKDGRPGEFEHVTFECLGYTFQPRRAQDRRGTYFVSFLPVVTKNRFAVFTLPSSSGGEVRRLAKVRPHCRHSAVRWRARLAHHRRARRVIDLGCNRPYGLGPTAADAALPAQSRDRAIRDIGCQPIVRRIRFAKGSVARG